MMGRTNGKPPRHTSPRTATKQAPRGKSFGRIRSQNACNKKVLIWTLWSLLAVFLIGATVAIWAYNSPESAPIMHARVTPAMEQLESIAMEIADVKWREVASRARGGPRFDCSGVLPPGETGLGSLHAQVVSLRRLPGRSASLRAALTRQGVNHEMFYGVDGLERIDRTLLRQYAGPHTLQLLGKEADSTPFWVGLSEKRSNGTISVTERNRLESRFAFAAKLSFLTLLHKMAGARWPLMLVFEDDAQLMPSFPDQLQKALCSLPLDWDILYLNSCYKRVGEFIGPGVRLFKDGACNLGFVISLRFALSTLHDKSTSPRRLPWKLGKEARRYNDMPFDLLIMKQAGGHKSFITDPPLVVFPRKGSPASKSVITGRRR